MQNENWWRLGRLRFNKESACFDFEFLVALEGIFLSSDSPFSLLWFSFTKLDREALFYVILVLFLSVCLSVCLSVNQLITHSLIWSNSQFSTHACLFPCLSVYVSVCLFTRLPLCLPSCLPEYTTNLESLITSCFVKYSHSELWPPFMKLLYPLMKNCHRTHNQHWS